MKMMRVPDELKAQTNIRLQLLKNGYRPLPTAEKVAFQKGWPTMPVNERAIKGWPMMGPGLKPAVTTAIQLEGNMLAIDIDVQDDEVSDKVFMRLMELFGDDRDWVPVRDSGGAKVMILCRTDVPYGMWKTSKYLDQNGDDHMVEVYGGASTRYFSCYGPHTLGNIVRGEYEVLKEYRWDGDGPHNLKPEELPLVSVDELRLALGDVSDILAAVPGWEKVKNSLSGDFEGGVVYDLTEDMVFDVKGGMQLDYFQAIAYALDEHDARCSSSFLDGESGNTSKCRMGVVGSVDAGWALSVFDHETWIQHYPTSHAPRTERERGELASAIGEAMRRVMPDEVQKNIDEAAEQGADVEAFEDAVYFLLDNLAFNNVSGAIHYLNRRAVIWNHVGKTTVKGNFAHLDMSWTGPRGGLRRYSPVDAWNAFDDKLKVAGVRFNPRSDERTFVEKGETYANGFFGLGDAPEAGDAVAETCLYRFLKHLVPDAVEREWLLDWLAEKWHRPWTRNCAVLFIAAGVQGAGRGTFFKIVDKAFNGYATSVSESDLLGARFNSFMENNLLVFCNELGGLGWAERKRGYETLKDRVDPSNDMITIERKGIEAYRTKTFTSFMLATNQPGALPMDAEDRRMAVIRNGKKLEGELLEEMVATGWDRLATALRRLLAHREPEYVVTDAPMFAGREDMLVANDTELDVAIKHIIDEAAPYRAWIRSDFEKAVKLEMTGSSNGRVPGLRQAVTGLVGRRAERFGAECLSGRQKVGDKTLSVIAKSATEFLSLETDARLKLCKGADYFTLI